MRVENNNSVNFEARLKNNEAFKRVFAKTSIPKINKNLVDEFAHNYPEHEIEILSDAPQKITGTSFYTLFDNFNGATSEVVVKLTEESDSLNKILEEAVRMCKLSALYKRTEEIYNALTK